MDPAAQPAVSNDENKENANTTTTTSRTSTKKTIKTEETIRIPTKTTTTKVKVDTTKMKTLCTDLEKTLISMVDETREDDLFIQRLQEEFLQADQKWEEKVVAISEDFLNTKKELGDDKKKKEVDDLNDELEELRKKVSESERVNHMMQFEIKEKDEEIERLKAAIAKMKKQLEDEDAWRDKVEEQLKDIERVKETTNQQRVESMHKVSDEIIQFRNKRVPDVKDLEELHHFVDRIHHSMGYLMVLGQQTPVTNDALNDSAPPPPAISAAQTVTEQAPAPKSDTPKEKKKNKVSLKAKRESMKAQENGQVSAGMDTEL